MSEALADFVVNLRAADVPELAIERSVDAIIDCLGCAFAGSHEPIAGIMQKVLTTLPPTHAKAVPMVGSSAFAAPAEAALYNGALSHALDFDDITHPAYAHATAVLLPTILSLAPLAKVSGREAVIAYVIGVEVFGKLGRALNTAHYRSGWHATSTLGSLAASAAAARLLRLDVAKTRNALSIGASGASGLRANFGTMTKPLHAGYAARNGVLAAQLAAEGFTATDEIIGADHGFAKAFNQNPSTIVWSELRRWGDALEILSEFGLALKPYPACGATHPSIEAAILLRADVGGRFADVARVEVGVPDMAFQPLIYTRPSTPLEGKFSMQFCVAAALVDGDVNLQTFSEDRIGDARIQGLLDKIQMKADPRLATNSEFGCIMEAQLTDGRRFTRDVPLAIGKPSRWFTRDYLRQKFLSCMAGSVAPAAAEEMFQTWLGMAAMPSLNDCIRQLSNPRAMAPAA